MKTYLAPEVIDFGSIAQITGLSGHISEQDTIVHENGDVTHLPGPASEIFCQTNPTVEVCITP